MEEKMESEMVERVADAIADAMNMNRVGRLEMEAAHAALQAMREPSEVMVESGGRAHDFPSVFMGGASHQSKKVVPKIWASMIDAALSGKSGMGEG